MPMLQLKNAQNLSPLLTHDFILSYKQYITLNIFPRTFALSSFCHNACRGTLSKAREKSTNVQYSFYPKEKYNEINAYSVNILSSVL